MEDLILYGVDRKKQAIIHDYIEFDCACGRNAYSDNDFVIKTPFDSDKLIEIGQWVSYGQTEYGGIIRSREIDTGANTVTYTGQSYRGILSSILARGLVFPQDGYYEGTPHGVMNYILQNNHFSTFGTPISQIYEAESEDATVAQVGAFSTSGLPFTNFLYLHDNIVKKFTTEENKPKKSRFSFRNGKITISFMDADTYYFDSSKVRLKYAENKNCPNKCYVSTRKQLVNYYSEFDGSFLYSEWQYKEGIAYLTADGEVTNNINDWICMQQPATDEICLVCESSGESQEQNEGIETPVDYPLDNEALDRLAEAQEYPSTEIEIDTNEAEIDDVVVASISELQMKVTRKVVETHLKISNGIPQITYTLEG